MKDVANPMNSKLRTLSIVALALAVTGCLSDEVNDPIVPPTPPPSGNSAPTISGNPPPAVIVGETYSFLPQASDSDGDSLTFTIQNMPTWAQFDTGIGRISGTPTLANIGIYSDIQVSVSDGQLSASTPNFTVEVTQVATTSTTLSWSAPTLNDDGTALTDLSGYVIYYGTSSRNYSIEIRIDNPSVTTYQVDNLSPNTYYFAATAVSSSGGESGFSGEAVRTLN